MGFLRKTFQSFIFSNLFIALCAAIMVYQTKYFIKGNVSILQLQLFLFFATLTSYSFHWYLTQAEQSNTSIRIKWLLRYRKTHLYLFYIGLIISAILLFSFVKYWLWFLPAMVLTFLYSAPKMPFTFFKFIGNFIVAKTLLLSIVWTYVTTALPFIIYGGEWKCDYTYFLIYRFTILTAICILFDIRDKDYDLSAGIKNIVIWFPIGVVKIIFWSMIALNLITVGVMTFYNVGWACIFTMLMSTIILASLFNPSLKSNNDYLFYLVLDGLMALSAVLLFLFNSCF